MHIIISEKRVYTVTYKEHQGKTPTVQVGVGLSE